MAHDSTAELISACSDVAARGLDIAECDAVVNLELPSDASHYAHRAGRTGRAGRKGVVVTLVEKSEQFVIEKLSKGLGVSIPELRMHEGMIAPVGSPEWDKQADDVDPLESDEPQL